MTDRIKSALAAITEVLEKIISDWRSRVWEAQGFSTWAAYVEAGYALPELAKEQRRWFATVLRDGGVPTWAIGEALGVSRSAIDRDLRSARRTHIGRIRADGVREYRGLSIRERLEWSSDRSGDCWLWTATLNQKGYGTISVNGRSANAHRVSYEEYVGPIPTGLVLDHLCRNRRCINPGHLEPVTQAENVRRGVAARRALASTT